MTCFARSNEECWRLGGVCSTHPKGKVSKTIDDLHARLAVVEQERDTVREQAAGLLRRFDEVKAERDAALAEVKALRERPSDAVADIEEADIAPNESEVNNAGEFLDHWFGEGKWPPVHKLDVILATYANAFALIALAALDAKEKS